MARITWGDVGERFYETGVDRGVLYPLGQSGVPWNGLISVEELFIGGEAKSYYIDGIMYLQIPSSDEYEATLTAIYRPVEFAECEGTVTGLNGLLVTRQPRKSFGFSYRTLLGNDTQGINHGYKIHMIYNALALPQPQRNNTITQEGNASTYSWRITARPIEIEGYKRTAHLIIDSSVAPADALQTLEDILYGSPSESARLPLPEEIQELFGYIIVVTDHGDGSFTVSGPDELVSMLDPTSFQIISSSAIIIDADTYEVSSS